MRRASIGFVLVLLGCSHRGQPHSMLEVSGDRSAVIRIVDQHFLIGQGGETRKVAFPPCMGGERPDELFVAGDGSRAVAVSWRSLGGSLHHHVEYELEYACAIDFTGSPSGSLSAWRTGVAVPDRPSVGWALHVGRHTGWLYAPGEVFDTSGASAPLPIGFREECELVELPGRAISACPGWDGHGTNTQHWVEIGELDTRRFPPVQTRRRRVEVDRSDKVRLSGDGTRVAWWEVALSDRPSRAGIIDVAAGTSRAIDAGQISDLDFAPEGDTYVVASSDALDRRKVTVRRSDTGASRIMRDDLFRIYWLADGHILYQSYGNSYRFELR